ncbi:MAG: ferrous iron transporter B, partial [bacterium]|nr:ferrous iron transporter B [bacterium]
IAGVGGVVIFLPQICMLFFFIALLEDCGYMARAAFLMDRLLTRCGLSGKSFIPMLSSFACAVPGVMATRTIEDRKDRIATMLVAPLMSCSARLPVYTIFIAAFIPDRAWGGFGLQGMTLFAMYGLGIVLAVPIAWTVKKTLLKGESTPFILELPSYKVPDVRTVVIRVYQSARHFLERAGTLILAATIVMWALAYFPRPDALLTQQEGERIVFRDQGASPEALAALNAKLASELIGQSYLGEMGKMIEPLVRPLGWDWRIGMATLASFPAREVIVAVLGTIYSLGEVDEGSLSLRDALQKATWEDGTNVFNIPVALSIMVFFALCAQCVSTLAVIQRETQSWRWPLLTFSYMTVLAYIGAFIAYQLGMYLGWG